MIFHSTLVSWFRASLPRPALVKVGQRRKTLHAQPEVQGLEQRTLLSAASTRIGRIADQDSQVVLFSNAESPRLARGIVRSAEALNSTTILVRFARPISPRIAPKLRFDISDLDVTGVRLAHNRRSAILTTAPQDDLTYSVRVFAVGRGADVRRSKGLASLRGESAPRILDVKVGNDETILVTFDRPMGSSALDPRNYVLADSTGARVPITAAQFVGGDAPASPAIKGGVRIASAGSSAGGSSQVMLQTGAQAFASYSFNVYNVSDSAGQQVFFEGRKITGNPKGAVVSVASTSSTRVVVSFNEPMADNALAPQHYSIKDPSGKPLLVTNAQFDGPLTMVVVLTTAAQANVSYQMKVSNITDLQNDGMDVVTGTFQGIAAPALVRAVPTDTNSVILTFSGAVGDSALAPSTYNIEKLDTLGNVLGTLPVQGSGFIGGQRTVVELHTPTQEDARYRITTTSALADVAGTPLPSAALEFRGINGLPRVVAASPFGPNTTLLTFSQPMSDDALSPSSYVIKDSSGTTLPVLNAVFVGVEHRVVQLTTAPQSAGVYTIQTVSATDQNGNAVIVSATPVSFQGAPSPSLISASSTDPTHVSLSFGVPVGDSALAPSSYTIEKLDPQGNVVGTLPITGVAFVGGQRTVVSLTTPTQDDATYRITTTTSLTSASGSALPIVQKVFLGLSGQPKLVSATPAGTNTTLLTFNQPMSDDALSPSSYLIKDAAGTVLPVLKAQFIGTERRVVQLTTAPQGVGVYTITSISATDTKGNPVGATGAAGNFQGSPSPSLSSATPTDPTHLVLTFATQVGDSALAPSSYKIEKLDPQGNVVGTLPITGVAFVGGQRTVVSLTTPTQDDATYRITTAVSLTDTTGSPLPVVQKTFQGISGKPVLVGVTSTGASTLLVTFSVAMSDDALAPSAYTIKDAAGATLPVLSVKFVGTERRIVELTTSPQTNQTYTIESITATGSGGGATIVPTSAIINSFPGLGTPGESTPVDGSPRVVGAASLSNTEVIVAFSEPMAANAIKPEFYFIVQQNVNPESGYLGILAATWYDSTHTVVLLTTLPQNELTYQVTAVAMTDVAGNALASPILGMGGIVIDPRSSLFPGTPPRAGSNGSLVDTDDDGLPDNVEIRGWKVSVTLIDGTVETRTVTSDPTVADTDGDGLSDYQEANIRTDPRSRDTDDDQLDDYAEFNEIYSNPLSQDSDGDSLDDFLEFDFFKTSPYLADTDGDQLTDDYEIFANRNPRVSDLPRPEITVGEVNLQLDVRFSETKDNQQRDLETKSISSSLTKSTSQSFTRSDTVTAEAHLEIQGGFGDGNGTKDGFLRVIGGGSVGYTFDQTSESASAAEAAYEQSLSTDKEVTRGYTVQRDVQGAVMQVTVNLRNLSSLAYRVKNLQVTAFIQDPQDHSKLKPVATLIPENEPDEGYTLGPLSPDKGPFIFRNDSIVPSLVESLMANSSGLIFRISNYDIIDENDRNFAFTSQEIVERTARLVIDYGGASSLRALLSGEAFDELKPGDETEIYRVATSAGQKIDDHRVIFDGDGKEVGITIFEALAAVGLTRYDEAATPTGGLSQKQILGSYSTYMAPAEIVGGISYPAREKIFRIRGISNDSINKKYWEILTNEGIDQVTNLKDLILRSDSPVSLNFVQDLDRDGLSADVEFFLRTSDSPLPMGAETPGTTDFVSAKSVTFYADPRFATGTLVRVSATGGGLVAGQDYYVRNLGKGTYTFYDTAAHALNAASTTGRVPLTGKITAGVFAALKPASNSPISVTFGTDPAFATASLVQVTATGGGLVAGTNYYVRNLGGGSYALYDSAEHATAGIDSTTGRISFSSTITAGFFSPTAKGRDTDRDGLDDRFEALIGWKVTTPQRTYQVYSSPNRADSNFDAPRPGVDSNGNGIADILEYSGTDLLAAPEGWIDKPIDTDGDGIPDTPGNGLRDRFEVFQLAPANDGTPDYVLDPSRRDTDNDGIDDATEILGFKISPITGETPYFVTTDPNNPFSDSDTFSDGLERLLGLNPRDGSDTDEDGDGLPDKVELQGWSVYTFEVSTTPYVQGAYLPGYGQIIAPTTTDVAAGALVFSDATDPRIQRFALFRVNTTGGGLTKDIPYYLGKLALQPEPNRVRYGVYLKASDAAAGTTRGAVSLTGAIASIQLATESRKTSRTDSVDSDNDGLTDYEEFFLGTNAMNADTDGDGIEDRLEALGYTLGHEINGKDIGIIRTDPLDADTDNDKLSDGAEAELVDIEQNRWVVRVRGEAPYRVFSNPLVADADFDGLVDGDEFFYDALHPDRHSDPNTGDTDGDGRDDKVERGKSNPLARDLKVTVVAGAVEYLVPGQYNFAITARAPDAAGTAGLSEQAVTVFEQNTAASGRASRVRYYQSGVYIAFMYYRWRLNDADTWHGGGVGSHLTRNSVETTDPGNYGVPVGATFEVRASVDAGPAEMTTNPVKYFIYDPSSTTTAIYETGGILTSANFVYQGLESPPPDLENAPLSTRSASFGLADDERFGIEGYFSVLAANGTITTVKLGGLEGQRASQAGEKDSITKLRPVFSYIQVADKFIEDFYFEVIVNQVSIAKLHFYYLIG